MKSLKEVTATRYVTPFREGGSMPGLVEADDLGMYVVKFRGAGQGVKVLVAEIVVGELARRLGFRIPEIVLVRLDPELARAEPDQEVQELLRASGGLNLGLDYLPGSFDFNPIVRDPGVELATKLLWFDALVLNVDRSWRNPNMLLWHREPWLIDHGAALYFHYAWSQERPATKEYRYDASDHAMLPKAASVSEVDAEMTDGVTPELLDEVLALVPDEWLEGDPAELRQRYQDFFTYRLANRGWVDSLRPRVPHVFEYALLRAVPRQERGEFMNVGVIVYCAPLDFLCAKTYVDGERLRVLDPLLDVEMLETSLKHLTDSCDGTPGAGPVSRTTVGQRFRWLTAPRSTIVQTSPAHTGFTEDPSAEVTRLFEALVLPPR